MGKTYKNSGEDQDLRKNNNPRKLRWKKNIRNKGKYREDSFEENWEKFHRKKPK